MKTCDQCHVRVPFKQLAGHQAGVRCQAAARTRRFYALGLRPLPIGNSLPAWVEGHRAVTRGIYEGEPRASIKLRHDPVEQVWIPRWVDIILELWAGPADAPGIQGEIAKRQRDVVLEAMLETPAKRQNMICEAFDREGLRGVREFLRPVTVGGPPQLIDEFEASVAALRR